MKVSNENRINLALTALGLMLLHPSITNTQPLQQPPSSLNPHQSQEQVQKVYEPIRSPHASTQVLTLLHY